MSANPTNAKMMMVNCIVNQSYNPVAPPNMNTPVMLVMMCWRCHSVQWLQPAKSIICGVCNATIHVPDHDPYRALPTPHSPKRAVICGIWYQNSSHKLNGSIDNAESMKDLLIKSFDFSESAIVMLTEEETDPFKTPTKYNLLRALYWLGQGCQQGDSLVFHYSGHGLPLRNYRLREVDGYNETLCPMDFETEGMIFDDEINAVIVGHLPCGVKLHAIIDSCHRKSVLDLPFLYRKNRSGQYEWENHSPRSDVFKGTSGGDVISFSGSVDVLTSADTPLLSETTTTGSMISCFIDAIKGRDEHKQTYGSILDSMRKNLIINPTGGNLRQEPLLSACGQFDVNSKIFTL